MPIYEYNENDHPAGFEGLRVAVSVGKELKQKYFPFRRGRGANAEYISYDEEQALRKKADEFNAKWKEQQKEAAAKNRKIAAFNAHNYKTGSLNQTGVRGVSAFFYTRTKQTRKGEKTYYTAALRVHILHNGVRSTAAFTGITEKNYGAKWGEAIRFYAEKKQLRKFSHLIERKPNITIFRDLAKAMRKAGHDIPDNRIP